MKNNVRYKRLLTAGLISILINLTGSALAKSIQAEPDPTHSPAKQHASAKKTVIDSKNDINKVLTWLKDAAALNDAQAQFSLALFYQDYPHLQNSQRDMLNWLSSSAAHGYKEAQHTLGIYFLHGKFQTKDSEHALYWFTQAALQGHAASQYNTGLMHEQGDGTARDPQAALHWYRKAAAQNQPDAQFSLGRMYLLGDGVLSDMERGLELISKSAEADHPAAQTMLATHIQQTANGKTAEDIQRAFELYLAAAHQNYSEAQFRVSVMFAKGQGVTKNEEQSVHWISKAAEQHHALAQYGLGAYLFYGVGVEKDVLMAAYWMSLAALQGEENALESRDTVISMLSDSERDDLDKRMAIATIKMRKQ